jgi:alkylation response protein AidB-like acyl-CoA dehydrogenase
MDSAHATRVPSGEEILKAAFAIEPEVRAAQDEIERARRLPAHLIEKMKHAGFFAMSMPKAWGGPETDPLTQLRIVEQLSYADGSVGWCTMIGCDSGYFTAFLDQDVARAMYPDIRVSTASALTLTGRAVKANGGYRVSGRWPFSSGCLDAAWIVGGCVVYAGDQELRDSEGVPVSLQCFFRPEEIEILDTWHTTGLRGSGSNDFAAQDVFVPEERTFSLQKPAIRRSEPLYALPMAILLKFATVPIGIARAAIDELIDAAGRRPTRLTVIGGKPTTAKLLRDEPFVQDAVARAEATVGSARSYLYDITAELWAALLRGDNPDRKLGARWSLAMANAFRASAEAVELMYKARGGSAVYLGGRLDRCLRDVLTINQHVIVSLKGYEMAGRTLLGLEPMSWVF